MYFCTSATEVLKFPCKNIVCVLLYFCDRGTEVPMHVPCMDIQYFCGSVWREQKWEGTCVLGYFCTSVTEVLKFPCRYLVWIFSTSVDVSRGSKWVMSKIMKPRDQTNLEAYCKKSWMNSCFIAVGPDRAHTGEYLPKILSKSVNICGNSGKITTNF